ncbi:electron transport complex subunit RsxC [Candidatus Fermentibacterales bacterium]|nr:electron transport complex subunit RsxC [Candidatus Fermentibacterales bacterium]
MARKRSFRGGTHPPGMKHLSETCPIERLTAPEVVRVALCQHLGAASKPCVEKGDKVRVGQEIGSQNGFISLPTHSPVAGKVIAVEEIPLPHRRLGPAVVIETSSEEGEPPFEPWSDFREHERSEIIDRIRLAGVCGMGGASFPTYVKLSPPPEKKIDTLILNGVECEPYLTADDRLMLERTAEVIRGMEILAYALGVTNCFIGIEANKPEAIARVSEAGGNVAPLRVKYPQGAEKQLIDAITGREVPVGGLPMDVGVLVQNVGTAAAAFEAVEKGSPSIRRIVTVTGLGVARPGNYDAPVGAPFRTLIEKAGGYSGDVVRLVSGGPMMGIAQYTDEVPVTKGTSGILALTAGEVRDVEESPCIGCAKCVDSCPMHLVPTHIAMYGEHSRWEDAEACGAPSCIECGTCSYVCPAGRYLVHYIRRAKDAIRALQAAKKEA